MGRKWLQNRRIRQAVAAAGAVALAGATVLQVTNSWAAGATYYVDAAAGNDANPGTSAAPWRSLAKINGAALTAGDTVLLRRGQSFTGELTLTRSGTATARITIDAYGSGARPIVRGGHQCIEIPASYVVVRRLHASDCGWAGVRITGSHNRFEYGKASHNGKASNVAGASSALTLHVEVAAAEPQAATLPDGRDAPWPAAELSGTG